MHFCSFAIKMWQELRMTKVAKNTVHAIYDMFTLLIITFNERA